MRRTVQSLEIARQRNAFVHGDTRLPEVKSRAESEAHANRQATCGAKHFDNDTVGRGKSKRANVP